METLETLAHQIDTVTDLRQLVRAMKTLSAASIHQYEKAVEALVRYERTIDLGFQIAMRDKPFRLDPAPADTERSAAVIVGSDHGLCGRFNRDIVEYGVKALAEQRGSPGTVRVIAVGARVADELEVAGIKPAQVFYLPAAVSGIGRLTDSILIELERFTGRDGGGAVAFFNRTEAGTTAPKPGERRLLPLDRRYLQMLSERPWPSRRLPVYSVDRTALMVTLTRQHLFAGLYRAIASSLAAEHGARLNAMQAAENNIEDHLNEMNAAYRRRRQEAVTQELMEVVMGYQTATASGSE